MLLRFFLFLSFFLVSLFSFVCMCVIVSLCLHVTRGSTNSSIPLQHRFFKKKKKNTTWNIPSFWLFLSFFYSIVQNIRCFFFFFCPSLSASASLELASRAWARKHLTSDLTRIGEGRKCWPSFSHVLRGNERQQKERNIYIHILKRKNMCCRQFDSWTKIMSLLAGRGSLGSDRLLSRSGKSSSNWSHISLFLSLQ